MPICKQIVNEAETATPVFLTLNLSPALLRRIKDRAIMAGMTEEQVGLELIQSALGERKDNQRKTQTRHQQQLALLRDAINARKAQ